MKTQKQILNAAAALTMILGSAALVPEVAAAPRPKAAPAPYRTPPAPVARVLVTVTGTVTQFNFNREFQVESVKLSGGQIVALPPHLRGVSDHISLDDTITVSGYQHTSPSGATRFHAEALTNDTTGDTLSVLPTAPVFGTISGQVQQLNCNPEGRINGFVVASNGSLMLVLFPPHLAGSLNVTVGSTVTVSGYQRTVSTGGVVMDGATLNGVTL